MLIQLNPQIPVIVTSKDNQKATAFMIIDYGQEHNLIFVVAMDDSGEVWCVPSPEIRLQKNWTMKRMRKS